MLGLGGNVDIEVGQNRTPDSRIALVDAAPGIDHREVVGGGGFVGMDDGLLRVRNNCELRTRFQNPCFCIASVRVDHPNHRKAAPIVLGKLGNERGGFFGTRAVPLDEEDQYRLTCRCLAETDLVTVHVSGFKFRSHRLRLLLH